MNDAGPQQSGPRHSLADHAFGELAGHAHGEGEDHDHAHDDCEGEFLDARSQELAGVPLLSMGVDVGSSGTQVVFSRLVMRGPGDPAALRRAPKSRETLYLSPVAMTPYKGATEIDTKRLRDIIDAAFTAAGLDPDAIETGVVILTGEALRRDNAEAITRLLAEECGELVTAAAGHHMEAMLAAHGSGAVRLSREQGSRILNLDIGGGTTKLAIVDDGRVIATGAIAIGGRLVALDAGGRIVRLDPAGRDHARRAGLDWTLGAATDRAALQAIAAAMSDALLAAIGRRPMPATIADLWLTRPIEEFGAIDGILASGGVAEFIYRRERRDFGDLGLWLGKAIAERLTQGRLPWPLLPAIECIRATALGASEYSVQTSGETSMISSPADLLPRRNLPVLQPSFDFTPTIDPAALAAAIGAHRAAFGMTDASREAVFAFRWRGLPVYERIRAFAEGLAAGLADCIAARTPLFIMLEGDTAQTLGMVLREELKIESEILVIDGIVLRDFDYVDIGRLRMPSGTVPVTIKSLFFPAALHKTAPGRRIDRPKDACA
jgi:ethanolamine utilization protein EutA